MQRVRVLARTLGGRNESGAAPRDGLRRAASLARDTVFNREVLGDAGLFFDDAESVTRLVDELDADATRAERLGALGPPRIEARYSWEHVVNEYDRVFRAAVSA